MRNKISIGIDPGLGGAVAAINAGSLELLEIADAPVVVSEGKRLYDIGGMGGAVVILEQAQAMPGQGVSSTFSTRCGFGIAGTPGEGKTRSIQFALRMFPGVEKPRDGRADALCLAYYGVER